MDMSSRSENALTRPRRRPGPSNGLLSTGDRRPWEHNHLRLRLRPASDHHLNPDGGVVTPDLRHQRLRRHRGQSALGTTTTYANDALGRVTETTDPDGNVNTMAYNCAGQETSEHRRQGHAHFDGLRQPGQRTDARADPGHRLAGKHA